MTEHADLDRKRLVFRLLNQALDLPDGERGPFLDDACADDPDLRRELDDLLAVQTPTEDENLLGEPAFDIHAADPRIGHIIGSHRLVRLIDRGGMGAVYLAERLEFDQPVALKLIRRGLDMDDGLVRRFHNERQILARLDHPHIARLLGGGTTSDRLPYFVMEYVEGQSLDAHCAEQQLPLDERLRLFLDICSAVQYAHQNLVVHRDLKPSNILITAQGDPKLLDFGIAKLLSDDDAERPNTALTVTGQGPMTPRYASPEQIRREPVTTACDVYSLGVLLYELLTGLSPYTYDRQRDDELARAICDQVPDKPSTAVRRREPDKEPGIPLEIDQLRRRLSGDLDSIVLRALGKTPAERYVSVEQFSADIRRYQQGLPVEAREGSFSYRATRFARRHWVALTAGFALVMLIFSAAFVSVWSWRQAQEAYAKLVDLIEQAAESRDYEQLTEALEKFVAKEKDPEARMRLWGILGNAHRHRGNFDKALDYVQQAYESALELYGDEAHPEVAKRLSNLGVLHLHFERHRAAKRYFEKALAMREGLGQEPIKLVRTQSSLATIHMRLGDHQRAEHLYRETLETRREYFEQKGEGEKNVATSHRSLAAALYSQDRWVESEKHLREALGIRRRLAEPGDSKTRIASVLDLLSRTVDAQGRRDEAETLAIEALDIRREELGEDHPTTAASMVDLGVLRIESDPDSARELVTDALEILEHKAPGKSEIADAKGLLGVLEMHDGNLDAAEKLLRESHGVLLEYRGEKNPRTRRAAQRLEALETARRDAGDLG